MVHSDYPYVDANGNIHEDLIRFYTDTPNAVLLQLPSGKVFGNEIVEAYPTTNSYKEINL